MAERARIHPDSHFTPYNYTHATRSICSCAESVHTSRRDPLIALYVKSFIVFWDIPRTTRDSTALCHHTPFHESVMASTTTEPVVVK